MLKIKPLVWEWEGNGSCYARTIVGNIYIDGATETWGVIAGGSVIGDYPTLELAQAAAEQWYRGKMMEGLECMTIEELRAALAEAEQRNPGD